jgi:endonuclease YncB( thermonuclease family)
MFGIRLLRYVRAVFKVSRPLNHQQASGQPTYTNKEQSESHVSLQFQDLPTARVKWVIDGDTVIVGKGRQETKIRLDSIDCPEDEQDWGKNAKSGIVNLIGGRVVLIEEHGLDCYGRTLATLYVWHEKKNEWLNVNERMVTLGHAWVMRAHYKHLPKHRQNKLNRLERWAKGKKIGLWGTPNPMPPWNWRNKDQVF